MRSNRLNTNSNNSGAIADIAFLLLIFFMVATSMQKEKAITMKLPPAYNGPAGAVNEKKVLSILINGKNELLIENHAQNIDNAATHIEQELSKILKLSNKAIINLKIHEDSSYQTYMDLLSIIKKTIKKTKEKVAHDVFNISLNKLSKEQYVKLSKKVNVKITESQFSV